VPDLWLTGDPEADSLLSADPFALCATPPAVHRYPGSMASRIQAVARVVADEHDGDVARLWTEGDPDGPEVLRRLKALPGFGDQKARIFLALLGKQLQVHPDGWREAAGPYGEEDARRSIADVTSPESLDEVRATKKPAKAAARAAKQSGRS
jgi:uncharacterized HhH-GPD family protein